MAARTVFRKANKADVGRHRRDRSSCWTLQKVLRTLAHLTDLVNAVAKLVRAMADLFSASTKLVRAAIFLVVTVVGLYTGL